MVWWGVEETLIVCQSPLAFVFMNCTAFQIQHLQFSNCGYQLTSTFLKSISFNSSLEIPQVSAAVAVDSINKIVLKNVVICKSLGYGLLVSNVKEQMSILSCSFLDNNKNCNRSRDPRGPSNTDVCIGGNVIIIFNSQPSINQSSRSIHVVINNTLIQGGIDQSRVKVTQCHKHDSSTSSFPYRANGLVLINLQNTYKIFVIVSHTNFTRNTGSNLMSCSIDS